MTLSLTVPAQQLVHQLLPQTEAGVLDLPRSDYVAFLRLWPRDEPIGHAIGLGAPLVAWLTWRIEERIAQRVKLRIGERHCEVRLPDQSSTTWMLPPWAIAHLTALRAASIGRERPWTAGELLAVVGREEQREARTRGESATAARGFAAIQQALWELLDAVPEQRVIALADAIATGQVDGARRTGASRCVVGWLESDETPHSYLVEGFVYFIRPGDTPETSGRLRRVQLWLTRWMIEQIREVVVA